ncbi:galactose/methyl galactoside ABC transporter permease MglC [Clostridium tagluense]|uniref:Galactoside ABC transporter permease MglC n=1 Tax=Clostridium tagluense TaxID=360422 RepID=A0A401US40_9CLOT|nr:galactose/methyl galactoside ABC transporter permease MglC [Clostridium tagluense]MBU3127742.1 galactose/methyl galactoside ABC transporter permease MglC [Clostridium tagluense]GCD12298.1 galactoside ABC transporter permease MglC [Clostridium tagluense]
MERLKSKNIQAFLKQNAIYVVLIVLIIGIAIKDPRFISWGSFANVLTQSSTRIIIALGACFAILTAGADLSAGRVVGLSAVISASMIQATEYTSKFYPNLGHLNIMIPILAGVIAGGIVGLLNGFIVSRFDVPPFIATLGTMVIVYGANSIYFDMAPNRSQPIGSLRSDFATLGTGSFLGIPYIVIIAALVTVIIYVVLNKTKLGKDVYAIGGNREAATVSGINVRNSLLKIYVIAGLLYGLAGVLEAARTGGATNNYGNGYELDAIAACVVGGWSVSGGVGTVPGIVVGVLIFSVINYGLTFIGINPYWQQIIKGVIIVSAVAVDIRKYLRKR